MATTRSTWTSARTNAQNHVHEELATLPGRKPPSLPGCSPEFHDIYRSLAESRVWLSSRREFYVDLPHALGATIDGVRLRLIASETAAISWCARSSPHYHDVLHEELFLTQIDRSAHPDVEELSNKPALLTVMCYVSVHRMPSHGVEREWTLDASELIEEYIRHLLRDIDEMKRAASLGTASGTRAAAQTIFPKTFVNDCAREFFVAEKRPENERVLRNLSPDKSSRDTNRVFIVVEASNVRTTYDFAHRRFREVLAARYVDRYWSIERMGDVLDRDDLAEFVVVPQRDLPKPPALGIAKAGSRESRKAHLPLRASHDVLRVIRPTAATLRRVSDAFAGGMQHRTRQRITLGGELLRIHDPAHLGELLERHFLRIARGEISSSATWSRSRRRMKASHCLRQ